MYIYACESGVFQPLIFVDCVPACFNYDRTEKIYCTNVFCVRILKFVLSIRLFFKVKKIKSKVLKNKVRLFYLYRVGSINLQWSVVFIWGTVRSRRSRRSRRAWLAGRAARRVFGCSGARRPLPCLGGPRGLVPGIVEFTVNKQ